MPVIAESSYRPNWLYRRAHPSTILPTLLRGAPRLPLRRERIELADGDFLDIDRTGPADGPTVVLCHGLEGNSQRQYMLGMAAAFAQRGWSAALTNSRGCSGEPNRLLRAYHLGATEDLRAVLDHLERDRPAEVALVGFSMGGNVILKYLGEAPEAVHPRLRAAATFSVPVDMDASSHVLCSRRNWIYHRRFLRKLKRKVRVKAEAFPGAIDPDALDRIRTLREFDDFYTAPQHGFAGATDYYVRNSSLRFLAAIRRPTLLVNALNDPFLEPGCFPYELAAASKWLHLETPRWGGHTGFRAPGEYWSERRAVEFVLSAPPVSGASLPADKAADVPR